MSRYDTRCVDCNRVEEPTESFVEGRCKPCLERAEKAGKSPYRKLEAEKECLRRALGKLILLGRQAIDSRFDKLKAYPTAGGPDQYDLGYKAACEEIYARFHAAVDDSREELRPTGVREASIEDLGAPVTYSRRSNDDRCAHCAVDLLKHGAGLSLDPPCAGWMQRYHDVPSLWNRLKVGMKLRDEDGYDCWVKRLSRSGNTALAALAMTKDGKPERDARAGIELERYTITDWKTP